MARTLSSSGRDGASLPADALARVDSVLAGRGIAAPFGLVVARTSDGQPIVVAGTDFERVRQLDRWWSVSTWPSTSQQALIGVRALPAVAPKNPAFRDQASISVSKDALCTFRRLARCRPARPKTAAFIFRWTILFHGLEFSPRRLKLRPAALPKKFPRS